MLDNLKQAINDIEAITCDTQILLQKTIVDTLDVSEINYKYENDNMEISKQATQLKDRNDNMRRYIMHRNRENTQLRRYCRDMRKVLDKLYEDD